MLASESEIAAFRTTLDVYDTATVEALMENRRALDEVRTRIDDMLLKAYVLPDGRRVFKSEDGTQVFDEHGNELGPDEIDADAIEDWRPRYEAYAGAVEEERVLLEERQELLDFQERVDEIRGRLDEDGITHDELRELEAELQDTMPVAVQRKLPAEFVAQSEPATQPGIELDLPDDLKMTRQLGAPPTPGG